MKPSVKWFIALAVLGLLGWEYWVMGGTTVTVTGEATVKAAPDEYRFYPTYEEKAEDKDAARTQVTEVGNGVVATLKELGVTDAKLATNVSVNEEFEAQTFPTAEPPKTTGFVGNYSITVTLEDLALARQVQEYLGTTSVVGSVTPTSTFKDATQSRLERDARKLALEDAKLQAADTAETLDLRIIRIETIGESYWGGPIAFDAGLAEKAVTMSVAPDAVPSPELLVGEQEVTYSIQVTYRLR